MSEAKKNEVMKMASLMRATPTEALTLAEATLAWLNGKLLGEIADQGFALSVVRCAGGLRATDRF